MVRSALVAAAVLGLAAACTPPVGTAPGSASAPPASPAASETPRGSAATEPASPSPGPQPRTVACGEKLTASVLVANDLTCTTDALVVMADGIVVDLNGHTFKGPGMGPQTWPAPQLDSVGVRVEGRTGVTVRNGSTVDFSTGVYFRAVTGGTVEKIATSRNRYGLYMHDSNKLTIRENTVTANIYGLHMQTVNDTLIQRNRFALQTYNSPGGFGLYLYAGQRNRITENDIENNVNWGIWFSEAKGNVTVRNNVIGNRPNVSDNTEGNVWYDAEKKEGNHWSDYPGRDTNNDGIGDTGSYVILGPADVVDPYPFVKKDGWKDRTTSTIDTYQPPAPRPAKQVRVLALDVNGRVLSARPGDAAATDTGVRASSIALQGDLHTLYALRGQDVEVWDARSDAAPTVRATLIKGGVIAANRDGVSALVVSPTGAQQIDTRTGDYELFAYAHTPGKIAPSYKHNHIFVGHEGGVDLFYLNLGGRTPYTIPIGGSAGAMAMSGSGTRIYVAVAGKNEIAVIDTEQYAVVRRITIGTDAPTALAVSPREDMLYVATLHELMRVDLRDSTVRERAHFLGTIEDLAVSPNGDELYAALAGVEQAIAVLRTADLSRANVVPLDAPPTKLLAAAY